MSTPALNPLPSAARMTTRTAGSSPERPHERRELVPARHVERVDRRVAHDDLGDAVGDRMRDGHRFGSGSRRNRTCFTWGVHPWPAASEPRAGSSSSPAARRASGAAIARALPRSRRARRRVRAQAPPDVRPVGARPSSSQADVREPEAASACRGAARGALRAARRPREQRGRLAAAPTRPPRRRASRRRSSRSTCSRRSTSRSGRTP